MPLLLLAGEKRQTMDLEFGWSQPPKFVEGKAGLHGLDLQSRPIYGFELVGGD